ncbi:MAG TPA: metalloregulator ArsR/SmtB family transcription factor [Tissierellaceae bacterium]|nr:metalloregulator ArsR/SmtB family transcription factor [Tissierellaceae bacterium]
MTNYAENARIFKVLSDPNRLKILDILSCGERCVCDILEFFDFTQPTLSYHMKVLMEAGLVNVRREGLWSHYSLNKENCNRLIGVLMNMVNDTNSCICKNIRKEVTK